jgi:ABC-type multidrug transport system fused ATPase/permease subunit
VSYIFYFLTEPERKRFFALCLLLILTAVMDWVWLGSIYLFSKNLLDPAGFSDVFALEAKQNAIVNMLLDIYQVHFYAITLAVVILASALRASGAILTVGFCAWLEHSVSTRLVESLTKKTYLWHVRKGHTVLSKAVLSEVTVVVFQGVFPLLSILGHLCSACAVLIALLIIDFKVTMIVLVFALGIYLALLALTKKALIQQGDSRSRQQALRFRWANTMLRGIKTIKLGSQEGYFIRLFRSASLNYAKSTFHGKAVAIAPKYIIECFIFSGLIITVLINQFESQNFTKIGSLFVAYALAAYRLMPSVQQIFVQTSSLVFSRPAMKELNEIMCEELSGTRKDEDKKHEFSSISLTELSFHYPESDRLILNSLSLNISRGKSIGIVGRTGSGKSTLVDILAGLISPTEGVVLVDENVADISQLLSLIAYVPQDAFVFNASILENITLSSEPNSIDVNRVQNALEASQLSDVVARFESGIEQMVGEEGATLSGGERQRLGIARALYLDKPVLILDESTSALDRAVEDKLISSLFSMGNERTLIFIAHRLDTLKLCNEIWKIENGRVIVYGSYEDFDRRR